MLIPVPRAAKIKTGDTSDLAGGRLPMTAGDVDCTENAGFEGLTRTTRGTRFGRYFIHG